MLADALLRSVGGATALLRMTGTNADTAMSELGLEATTFVDAVIGPVVMRRLRPNWAEGNEAKWELLVSATSVQAQIVALDVATAQALFAMTLLVTVAGADYLIEAVSANEAFGTVYLYRLLLREAHGQAI